MNKKVMKTLRNNKGQIGEILVVVVLIILAILGIVKYVMPMFDKNKALSGAAGTQMDTMSKDAVESAYGSIGDEVPAQTVINTWNKFCNDSDVTVTYTNLSGGGADNNGSGDTYGAAEAGLATGDQINRMGTYRVDAITFYDNHKLETIEYTQVN